MTNRNSMVVVVALAHNYYNFVFQTEKKSSNQGHLVVHQYLNQVANSRLY